MPVVSLWFPYQNISDLWRALGRVRPSWQVVWWLLWVVSNVISQISSRIYLEAVDLEQLRVAMALSLGGEILLLAAAPFAWLVVRGITQGVVDQAPISRPSPVA